MPPSGAPLCNGALVKTNHIAHVHGYSMTCIILEWNGPQAITQLNNAAKFGMPLIGLENI